MEFIENAWELDDVKKEIKGKPLFEVLCIYNDRKNKQLTKSQEYVQALKDKNEEGKNV